MKLFLYVKPYRKKLFIITAEKITNERKRIKSFQTQFNKVLSSQISICTNAKQTVDEQIRVLSRTITGYYRVTMAPGPSANYELHVTANVLPKVLHNNNDKV